MKPRHKRLVLVGAIVLGVGSATALAVTAFRQNMLYFFSPTQVSAGEAPIGHTFRLGGLVETGSLKRRGDGLTVDFVVTDTAHRIPVTFSGILPDLFREGQGIVALGKLSPQGQFKADEVLAKHDENYMPPEVADALKTAGAGPASVTGRTGPAPQ
jgi:cytochrome c-type biogenesis protein CcmE